MLRLIHRSARRGALHHGVLVRLAGIQAQGVSRRGEPSVARLPTAAAARCPRRATTLIRLNILVFARGGGRSIERVHACAIKRECFGRRERAPNASPQLSFQDESSRTRPLLTLVHAPCVRGWQMAPTSRIEPHETMGRFQPRHLRARRRIDGFTVKHAPKNDTTPSESERARKHVSTNVHVWSILGRNCKPQPLGGIEA